MLKSVKFAQAYKTGLFGPESPLTQRDYTVSTWQRFDVLLRQIIKYNLYILEATNGSQESGG